MYVCIVGDKIFPYFHIRLCNRSFINRYWQTDILTIVKHKRITK